MNGVVIPEIISKFLPSKVMITGTFLNTNNQYKTTSTKIRVVCKIINNFISKLSMYSLPFDVQKRIIMKIIGGNISKRNLGGSILLTV